MEGHKLGKKFLKEEVGRNIFYGEEDVFMKDGFPIDKIGKVFHIYDLQVI